MKTLIIGMGALGGLIAGRLRAAGLPGWLATRDAEQADRLRASGLRVTGVGGAVIVQATAIAPLEAYAAADPEGGVPQILAERLGSCVLGGLSNLGATMETLGIYEQPNAGHLLVGELAGGEWERTERVRRWLERAVQVRATRNLRGAVWSKLLVNCSVTTNRRDRWRHHA